jgi:hypothetical protein
MLMLLGMLLAETAPKLDQEQDDENGEQSDEQEQEPSEEEQEGGEEIRDPVAKLHAERSKFQRLSKKLTAAEEELAELRKARDEDPTIQALRASRIETAFLHAVISSGESYDLEAMWDLANVRGFLDAIDVSDDGEVSGMDEAIGRVLDRYPWLREDETIPSTPSTGAKQPTPKLRRSTAQGPSASSMRERFPALKKGGR